MEREYITVSHKLNINCSFLYAQRAKLMLPLWTALLFCVSHDQGVTFAVKKRDIIASVNRSALILILSLNQEDVW